MKTSASSGENVNELFKNIIELVDWNKSKKEDDRNPQDTRTTFSKVKQQSMMNNEVINKQEYDECSKRIDDQYPNSAVLVQDAKSEFGTHQINKDNDDRRDYKEEKKDWELPNEQDGISPDDFSRRVTETRTRDKQSKCC